MAETNPLKAREFERLHKSIEWSQQQLEFPRSKRVEAIKEFVGYHYSEEGAEKRVPTPFLKLAVTIFARLLAPRAPRVLIGTNEPGFEPVAANFELALNQIPAEIDLQHTLRNVVIEALFSSGWVKTGLHTVGEILGHDYGQPFVDIVTLDDLLIDMAATRMDQIQYIGNEYWVDYEDVMDSDWFPKNAKRDLKADEFTVIGSAGEDRAESISINSSAEVFREKIKLRDVWLPKERLMVTYAVRAEKRLKVVEQDEPKHGPYIGLGFDHVPGNLMPLPPVAMWRDLHEMANSLFRKLGDQADAQKSVLGFSGGDEESAKQFQGANDCDGITYNGAEPKSLQVGGVDQLGLAFWLQCRDIASYFASNLDSLGGLAPQAETLGQDKLMAEASNAQLRDMALQVIDFSKKLFGVLAYHEWSDPVRRRVLTKGIPGTNLSIVVPWDQSSKQGQFDFYDLDIDVYSLQDDSPAAKMQKLEMILQRFVSPMMPQIQEVGGVLDIQLLFEIIAKYSDFDELRRLIIWADQAHAPGAEPPGMPIHTTRTYERVNRPGATDHGKSQILQDALMGGQPQGSEVASLGRRSA